MEGLLALVQHKEYHYVIHQCREIETDVLLHPFSVAAKYRFSSPIRIPPSTRFTFSATSSKMNCTSHRISASLIPFQTQCKSPLLSNTSTNSRYTVHQIHPLPSPTRLEYRLQRLP